MSARPVTQTMLDECSREPIHIPGAIQPHGALLTLRLADLAVQQASANGAAWFGSPVEALVGRPLAEALPELHVALIGRLPEAGQALTLVEPVRLAGRALAITLRRQGDLLIVEVEPDDHGGRSWDALAILGGVVEDAAAIASVEALAERAAAGVHAITAYDRVMVYRFDPDGHGEVIAEAVNPGVDRFLGLRYPASDVPVQARAIFQRIRVRVIADSAAGAVPLIPRDDPIAGAPLDLGDCVLRAVSPVHLEYLRNMGVAASLTAAITVDGRLWGLLACHHLAQRPAGHALRAQVDLVAQVLAGRLAELDHRRRTAAQIEADRVQRELLAGFGLDLAADWTLALMRPDRVLPLVGATGAVLATGGAILTAGAVPPPRHVERLLEVVLAHGDDVFATDSLPRLVEGFADQAAVASGCLAVRLDPERRDVLLWLRPEQVRTVTWGGDPRKPVSRTPDEPQRLHPRTSFAAWRELVYQRSRDWTIEERATAQAIQQHLRLVVHRLYEVKRALEHSNRELTEFAHAAAHDLQEPLRTIGSCCDYLAKHLDTHVQACGRPLSAPILEFLGLARDGARRGQALVGDLLDYARLEHGAPAMERVALDRALADATAALAQAIAESDARIDHEPLPPVVGNRRQLTQLLQNLLGNAIKYRGSEAPRVRVAAQRRAGGWELTVADNGIGIPEGDRERIFTIFTRLHGRSRYPGTGVGLALCRKIAALHGGRIWAESEPGRGSVFHVVLADQEEHRA